MKNLSQILMATLLALACFALLPTSQAVSPAPDGCYPNFTTAEGCKALNLLTTGSGNTGLGWFALSSDTDGSFNTGVGWSANLQQRQFQYGSGRRSFVAEQHWL